MPSRLAPLFGDGRQLPLQVRDTGLQRAWRACWSGPRHSGERHEPLPTAWLVEVARQAHGAGTTRGFVATEMDQPHVVACDAWGMASVAIADLSERL